MYIHNACSPCCDSLTVIISGWTWARFGWSRCKLAILEPREAKLYSRVDRLPADAWRRSLFCSMEPWWPLGRWRWWRRLGQGLLSMIETTEWKPVYDSSCVIPVCVSLRVCSSFSVWSHELDERLAGPVISSICNGVYWRCVASHTLLLDFAFFFSFLFSTCVLFTSLITCSTKIPWRAWMFSSLQLFWYMLYSLWELDPILFGYCSICSCDRVLIGFEGVPDRPWNYPNTWRVGCLVWMAFFPQFCLNVPM